MKYFNLIPAIWYTCLLVMPCDNNSFAKDNINSVIIHYSKTPAYFDKGNFTLTVDGKPISIAVQKPFSEFRLDPYSKGINDGIMLVDGNEKKEGFQFEIKKSGTTKIKNDASGDA